MTQKFKIEKNVPMPVRSQVPPLPLGELDVGQSFVYELEDERDHAVIRQRLTRFQKRNPPVRFSMNRIDETKVRIHRIEDAA